MQQTAHVMHVPCFMFVISVVTVSAKKTINTSLINYFFLGFQFFLSVGCLYRGRQNGNLLTTVKCERKFLAAYGKECI